MNIEKLGWYIRGSFWWLESGGGGGLRTRDGNREWREG